MSGFPGKKHNTMDLDENSRLEIIDDESFKYMMNFMLKHASIHVRSGCSKTLKTTQTKVNMRTHVSVSCVACHYEFSIDLEPHVGAPYVMQVVRDEQQKEQE